MVSAFDILVDSFHRSLKFVLLEVNLILLERKDRVSQGGVLQDLLKQGETVSEDSTFAELLATGEELKLLEQDEHHTRNGVPHKPNFLWRFGKQPGKEVQPQPKVIGVLKDLSMGKPSQFDVAVGAFDVDLVLTEFVEFRHPRYHELVDAKVYLLAEAPLYVLDIVVQVRYYHAFTT